MRNASRLHILGILGERRLDALKVFQQRRINLVDVPTQAGWIDTQVMRGSEYNSTELPESGADLFSVVVQPLERRELIVGWGNQRMHVIRTPMPKHPVE
jgi:hypothetical protein